MNNLFVIRLSNIYIYSGIELLYVVCRDK